MDVKNLKQAEKFLVEITQDDGIPEFITNELYTWDLVDAKNSLDVCNINQLFTELYQEIFKENQNDLQTEALHWLVFDRLHDVCITYLKEQFSDKDKIFFEKCNLLSAADVSAQQLGADENYNIPLAAAIVELSVLDRYRTPNEKMNCLWGTYDLVFAEIKTAMVTVIAQNSEKENDIPIIDNRDVIPVLMVVLIKSKLVHVFSNLFYIKCFHCRVDSNILESFEKAVETIMATNLEDLQPVANRMLKSIDLEQYMKITSSEAGKTMNRTLVDEANQRALNLITRATVDE